MAEHRSVTFQELSSPKAKAICITQSAHAGSSTKSSLETPKLKTYVPYNLHLQNLSIQIVNISI